MSITESFKQGWNELTDRDKLEFDTDNLVKQAAAIGKIIEDLQSAQKELTSNVNQLRLDWQTEAGDEFFKKYDEKWLHLLDGHIKLLGQLVTALNDCAKSYEPVSAEYDKITL